MFFVPYGTAEKSPRKRFPWITALLVVLNVAVFGLEVLIISNLGDAGLTAFLDRYAFVPASLDGGSVPVGLITSLFLHAGVLHLVGNMIYLMPFGDNVEDRLGHARYILFYLLCGVLASLAYAAFNQGSTTPLVGASGAIGGVLGGYLALHPRGSKVRGIFFLIIIPFKIALPAILFIGYWFVMQVISSAVTLQTEAASGASEAGGVAFIAHVGGFLAGLVLAPLLALPERRPDETPPSAQTPPSIQSPHRL